MKKRGRRLLFLVLSAFFPLSQAPAEQVSADALRAAAERGDSGAQTLLAVEYFQGRKRAANLQMALYWFRKAAANGSAEAEFNLGLFCEHAIAVPRSTFRAFEHYRKAAEAGLPMGKFKFAELLLRGIPPENDPDDETRLLHPGISADLKEGKKRMDELFRSGLPAALRFRAEELSGTAETDEERTAAASLLRRAADAGDVKAMRLFAGVLCYGRGVPADPDAMAAYLRKAAEAGDPESAALLGVAYASGLGVAPDMSQAIACYRAAAQSGNPMASCKLAEQYESGVFLEADLNKAVALYRLAAQGGHPGAMLKMAHFLQNGIGMDRDERAAFEWLMKAAARGDAEAQYHLAAAFRDARGTPEDKGAELYWLKRAAAQKHPGAEKVLKEKLRPGTP